MNEKHIDGVRGVRCRTKTNDNNIESVICQMLFTPSNDAEAHGVSACIMEGSKIKADRVFVFDLLGATIYAGIICILMRTPEYVSCMIQWIIYIIILSSIKARHAFQRQN